MGYDRLKDLECFGDGGSVRRGRPRTDALRQKSVCVLGDGASVPRGTPRTRSDEAGPVDLLIVLHQLPQKVTQTHDLRNVFSSTYRKLWIDNPALLKKRILDEVRDRFIQP